MLRREAAALLELAATRSGIDHARAVRFARAVLELEPTGRLALAVLDGGLFAGARLVELAGAVVTASGKQRREQNGGGEAG